MKIIHGSLSALLVEVKEHGKVDGVRVAALMQSTAEGAGIPRYTSWVIVSADVDWGAVGRVAARGGPAAGGGDRAGLSRSREARRASPRRSSPRCAAGSRRRGSRCATGSSPPTRRRSKASWTEHGPPSPARPAGADNFLKWRRSIDEHLELGRLTWDEYGDVQLALHEGRPAHGDGCARAGPSSAEQTRLEGQARREALPRPEDQGLHRLPRASRLRERWWKSRSTNFRSRRHLHGARPTARRVASAAEVGERNSRPTGASAREIKHFTAGRSRSRKRSRSSLRVRSADAVHRHHCH